MKKVLIIDNGTIDLDQLKEILSTFQEKIIKYTDIEPEEAEDFDLIVLTGSSSTSIIGHEINFVNEIEIIKRSSKPIIGICLGFELISVTFGAKLQETDKEKHGIYKITPIKEDKMFDGVYNYNVYEAHRWVVSEISNDSINNIEALARSDKGFEIIKHNTRDIYGFQFHPEMFIDKTCGYQILKNVLNTLGF